jgi:hypothetical protein
MTNSPQNVFNLHSLILRQMLIPYSEKLILALARDIMGVVHIAIVRPQNRAILQKILRNTIIRRVGSYSK